MGKSQLETAREIYNKAQPQVNGMEAWIINSPWGIGLRYYPVGQAHEGMEEVLKDGTVTLIEKLQGVR